MRQAGTGADTWGYETISSKHYSVGKCVMNGRHNGRMLQAGYERERERERERLRGCEGAVGWGCCLHCINVLGRLPRIEVNIKRVCQDQSCRQDRAGKWVDPLSQELVVLSSCPARPEDSKVQRDHDSNVRRQPQGIMQPPTVCPNQLRADTVPIRMSFCLRSKHIKRFKRTVFIGTK